jgi:hypothetical protein
MVRRSVGVAFSFSEPRKDGREICRDAKLRRLGRTSLSQFHDVIAFMVLLGPISLEKDSGSAKSPRGAGALTKAHFLWRMLATVVAFIFLGCLDLRVLKA